MFFLSSSTHFEQKALPSMKIKLTDTESPLFCRQGSSDLYDQASVTLLYPLGITVTKSCTLFIGGRGRIIPQDGTIATIS